MKAFVNGAIAVEDVIEARAMSDRMRGLLGRAGLPRGTAMLIEPCGAIHTFFMRFILDIIFLDFDNRVVKVSREIKPWRMASGGLSARKVLELEAGLNDLSAFREGATVEFC